MCHLTFAGRDIPYKVLGGPSFAEYPLIYATDQYLYYAYDPDAVLMIKTDTGELVSDNCFAEMGLYDSQEAVDAGTEKLLEFKEFE